MTDERYAVRIRHNTFGEYEVPTEVGPVREIALYYTDDRQDAIDTARAVFCGQKIKIVIRAGSYSRENAG